MSSVDAYKKQAAEAVPLVRHLCLVRELAEASVVAIVFAVAILVVGTPIALAVRALHDIVFCLHWACNTLVAALSATVSPSAEQS